MPRSISAPLPLFAASSRLLSTRETMSLLNVKSRTTLWRYSKKFGLKPFKIGSEPQAPTKYRYDEVMYWLDNQKRG